MSGRVEGVASSYVHENTIDTLRVGLLFLHAAIILYVCFGWTVISRDWLFAYLLVLPLIAMQWLFNGGASIVHNIENLARGWRWHDGRNNFEGAFFKTLLRSVGINASHGQVNTVICFVMFMFWVSAFFHMVLVVPETGLLAGQAGPVLGT